MTLQSWSENNQSYLASSIDHVKSLLEKYVARTSGGNMQGQDEGQNFSKNINLSYPDRKNSNESQQQSTTQSSALETISALFSLSNFEKLLLVLCAGVELNSEICKLCAKIHGDMSIAYPTFGMALAILPDAHWSALSPVSPLRRFKLIDVYGFPQMPLTGSILRIDERILHYLVGISYLEKQLQGIVKPVRLSVPIVESHKILAEHIMFLWKKNNTETRTHPLPYVQLRGSDETSKLILAQWVCYLAGLGLWHLPAELLPPKAEEIESLIQIWTREAALLGAGLYVSLGDVTDHAKQKSVEQLIENIPGVFFLGTPEPLSGFNLNRETIIVEVKKPLRSEQQQIWKSSMEKEWPMKLDNDYVISKLVNQFDMNAYSIQLACSQAHLMTDECSLSSSSSSISSSCTNAKISSALWESSRTATRPKMAVLAQHILPKATMGELVLAEREKQLLHDIVMHVKHRNKVYEEWGFDTTNGNCGSRGLGISALFSGDSGTGKTMAAEALAIELNLDLFRIDLSMVVSKYIGETEKNLRQIFDAAEYSGSAILFFDEADTLFGKRTEVKDSHDRYANIEVGYLLQRMESYKGLAILTTNMKKSLDSAFMRRIRFVVNFQFPDEKNRVEIWKRVFPKSTKTENLDIRLLARLNITGGHIHNIALNASFLAADQGVPVNMNHIKQSIKVEYDKMERPLTNVEIGDDKW